MCNRQPMAALSLLLLVLIASKLKSILLKKMQLSFVAFPYLLVPLLSHSVQGLGGRDASSPHPLAVSS